MSYKSRLPHIAAELAAKLDGAVAAVAEEIARGAKDRVPVHTGTLRDAIHVERRGIGEHEVIAGDNRAFYGNIVEHGGAYTPARPFLNPAVEQVRPQVEKICERALGDL